MRPRRRILVYCEDAERAGVLAFALCLGPRYKATVCCDVGSVAAATGRNVYDAAVLLEPSPEVAITVRARRPQCRILVVGDGAEYTCFDTRVAAIANTAVIMDALMLLTIRKRGPRFKRDFPEVVARTA